MSSEQRLRQHCEDLQALWETARQLIRDLRQQEFLETRSEEKHRMQKLIEQRTQQLRHIEKELRETEAELKKLLDKQGNSQRLPQATASARLLFNSASKVRQTLLFSANSITLGRPMTEPADLWLTLRPLDNPRHHSLMDLISRTQAMIEWDQQPCIRHGGSRNPSYLNDELLDKNWRLLQHGDQLAFLRSKALQLGVSIEADQWLRLDRINNGVDEENYLLLRGSVALATDLELSHQHDGFMLKSLSDLTLNGDKIDSGTLIGLRDGDRIVVGNLVFDFYTDAYSPSPSGRGSG